MNCFAIDSWANIGLKYDCRNVPKNREKCFPCGGSFSPQDAEDAKEEKGLPRVDADDRGLQGEKRKQSAVSNQSEAEFFTTEDTEEQSGHIYPRSVPRATLKYTIRHCAMNVCNSLRSPRTQVLGWVRGSQANR